MKRASIIVVATLAAILGSPPVMASINPQMCQPLAEFAADAAGIRDIGANVDKHVAAIRTYNAEAEPDMLALVERVTRAVYASKGAPEAVGYAVYHWCISGGDGTPL